MPKRVEIESQERVFDEFFKIDSYRVRYEQFDGSMSDTQRRLVFERGDSVAVLPYDKEQRQVILVRQFRLPVYVRDQSHAWLWETIAGMIDEGRTAREVAVDEAEEESGYRLNTLTHVMTVYPSPGGTSERIHIYLAPLLDAERVSEGGGLEDAGEDIEVRTLALGEALRMVRDGEIVDAKTVVALQHLQAHWDEL